MKRLFFTILIVFLFSHSLFAATWSCQNRSGGIWTWGRTPDVCDMDRFIDPYFVNDLYDPYFFDNSKDSVMETTRYVNEMYGLIRETELEVLDFQVTYFEKLKRHYLVKYKGFVGYIYGGDKNDYDSWL